MQAQTQVGASNSEYRIRLVEHARQRAASAEQLDPADIVRVGEDGELEVRFQRRIGVAQQRGERGRERAVLNTHSLRHALLRADMAAFVSDGSQLVITIGQGRGVEGESQWEVGCPGGEVEVVARLEISQVLIEPLRAGGLGVRVDELEKAT